MRALSLVLLLPACGSSAPTDGSVPLDLSSSADLAAAPDLAPSPDLAARPDLLSSDFAYAGPCTGPEPPYAHAGLPPQGWDFAALNGLFDYAAAPTLREVLDVPATAGMDVDGAFLLSSGDFAILPNDNSDELGIVSPTCVLRNRSTSFDGSMITIAEIADGRAVSEGGNLTVWALGAAGAGALFADPGSPVQAVAQLPAGNVAALSQDGMVRELDAQTGAVVGVLATGGDPKWINLAVGPDGALYAAEFTSGTVWRAPAGGAFASLPRINRPDTIEGIAVLPNGDILLANFDMNVLERVDPQSGQPVAMLASGLPGSVRSLQLAPNGRVYLACNTTVYRVEFPAR